MPATLGPQAKADLTPEEIRESRTRERQAARFAWEQPRAREKRDEVALVMAARWLRFHRPSRGDRNYLEQIAADLERLVMEMTAAMEHPGDLVTGNTWTAAAERRERYAAELMAVRKLLGAHLEMLR